MCHGRKVTRNLVTVHSINVMRRNNVQSSRNKSNRWFCAEKNIIQYLVLVMDNAWFLFIRNANDQNLDVGVVKTPMHLLKFP